MLLAPGTRLGPYEILSAIGAGGMGEVYRGRDTRLDRLVAVKVLPAAVARTRQMRERFEREAKAISMLNQPHICALYDVGSENGIDFLVMEFLDGETLADRLKRGPIPSALVFQYAIEIAGALEAAHTRGIVHRDLKPGNIMLAESGAKLLDFGLAKMQAETATPDELAGMTQTAPITNEGALVGTLPYMAPEQLNGEDADARTDIFAFGAILYEMATGRRAFEGKGTASLIASIMHDQPARASGIRTSVPVGLDHVIEQALAKDPKRRWQSIADVRLELEWLSNASSGPAIPVPRSRARAIGWGAAAIVLVVGASAVAFSLRGDQSKPSELRHLTYSGHDSHPAAAPDGRTVAFMSDRDGAQRIWLKEVSTGNETPITEGPRDDHPRFSPDSSAILFTRDTGKSKWICKISTLGGSVRKLVDGAELADWSPDGRQIAYVRVLGENGIIARTIEIAAADGSSNHHVAHLTNTHLNCIRWSPDGRTIAGAYESGLSGVPGSIFLVGTDGANPRSVLAPRGGSFILSIAWSGRSTEIVYSQSLGVRPSLVGRARIVRQNVANGSAEQIVSLPYDSATVDVLASGTLVLDAVSSRMNLREAMLARDGPGAFGRWLTRGGSNDYQPVYSPDGKWVLFTSNRSGNLDLWEISQKDGSLRRLTEDPGDDWDPGFTRDGKIIWSSNRTGNLEIWIADSDGAGARQLTRDGVDAENPSATPDGWIIYASGNPSKKGVWKIRRDGTDGQRLVVGAVSVTEASPDGQFVAYRSLPSDLIRVARTSDGSPVTFETDDAAIRSRWLPGGRSLAFFRLGEPGVFVQDFVPGRDTIATRRRLVRPDSDVRQGYFGISPDGIHAVVTYIEEQQTLMTIDHVRGISRSDGHSK